MGIGAFIAKYNGTLFDVSEILRPIPKSFLAAADLGGRMTFRITPMKSRILRTLLIALVAVSAHASARKPNVILIMADDLGYGDLGCYGHASIRTPALDRLARDGIRLTDFHSGATVCTPARMALLTGAYPVRLGWTRGVTGHKMGWHDGMSPEALTIAEIFQSEGYATAISGKWHIGDQADTRPTAQGFDSACFITHSNNQGRDLWHGGGVVEKSSDNRLLSEKFTSEAIRFIRSNKERPFFLYLPHTAPHFPVQPHPEWKGRSRFGDYGDVVEELDFRIGEMMETLREMGIDRHTIVVFTSDNGPNPGEQSDAGPFRGEKWSALEGGTRVPCIISWPGVIPAAKVSDALISAMDLLPSLSRACGIDWRAKSHGKPQIDGLDVWDTLLGKQEKHPRDELLYWHGMDPEPHAIRVGQSKLFFDRRHALEGQGAKRATPEQAEKIKAYREVLHADAANTPMLFHLKNDPGETIDVSGEFPNEVKTLSDRAELVVAGIKAAGILSIATPHGRE